MQKKWLILNIIVLILVVFILVWISWSFSFSDNVVPPEECVAVNKVASFVYDACYDAYSKNIFLEAKRSFDSYRITALEFSFFDFSDQVYKLTDVPNTKSAKAYKIPAERNPQNIYVSLDIIKDFSAPICEEPRGLFVRYCPAGVREDGINVSISPLEGVGVDDFIEIEKAPRQDSDVFALNLVDKERIWKSKCESRWSCDAWEACEDGVQRRECKDAKDCFIPTGAPDTVKSCDGSCSENWECEWSACSSGFTIPRCKDLSNCGTSYNIPQKLECGSTRQCTPDIECSDWSACGVDYNFMDLVGGVINELSGVKSRLCEDRNACAEPQKEVRKCSVNVDIYTRRFSKCGESFIGVYNRLNNDLIARIEEGKGDSPYLNINLDDGGESPYCDYCFDGKKSGDEEGIDCGGGCEACADKYRRVDFRKKTIFTRFSNWIKKMLT